MPDKPLAPEHILDMLAGAPPRLDDLAAGIAPDLLRARPAPGAWSANEVLAHLRACADVWGGCIRAILAEDAPTLRAVNPTTWIGRTDYRDLEFRESLRAFAAQRDDLLARLGSLPPDGWSRAATVTGAGKPLRRSVHSYAQWLATHERPHLRQVARVVAALRTEPPAAPPASGGPGG